jgi:hypothetical protein
MYRCHTFRPDAQLVQCHFTPKLFTYEPESPSACGRIPEYLTLGIKKRLAVPSFATTILKTLRERFRLHH